MSDTSTGNVLRLAQIEDAPNKLASPVERPNTTTIAPLLLDINALSVMLSRSVASLFRDDSAGRLPAALRVGGSKRWRASDIALWVELGCPSRAEFEARRKHR